MVTVTVAPICKIRSWYIVCLLQCIVVQGVCMVWNQCDKGVHIAYNELHYTPPLSCDIHRARHMYTMVHLD
jgi:hypothetical protein